MWTEIRKLIRWKSIALDYTRYGRKTMMLARTFSLSLMLVAGVKAVAFSFVVQGPSGEIKELRSVGSDTKITSLGQLPANGQVIAARDFDGNGSTDLVLRYDPDGAGRRPEGVYLWRFNGAHRIGVTQIGGVPSSYTVPVGVCDLDKNGNSEFLLYNPINHAVKAFEILKNAPFAGGQRTVVAGGQTTHFALVIGAGDADQDGNDDLVLQDETSKELKIRYLMGPNTSSFGNAMGLDAPAGRAVGVGYVGAPSNRDLSVIYESPDGVAPRQRARIRNDQVIGQSELTFDGIYRSWPIVAIVP
jgi:hypothetical protein